MTEPPLPAGLAEGEAASADNDVVKVGSGGMSFPSTTSSPSFWALLLLPLALGEKIENTEGMFSPQ